MFLKSLYMIVIGFASGTGVAAGTFAFLVVIRIIPRLVQKAKLEHKIINRYTPINTSVHLLICTRASLLSELYRATMWSYDFVAWSVVVPIQSRSVSIIALLCRILRLGQRLLLISTFGIMWSISANMLPRSLILMFWPKT